MAENNLSLYPGAFDDDEDSSNLRRDIIEYKERTNTSNPQDYTILAQDIKALQDCIINIEKVLGLNPNTPTNTNDQTIDTVKERIDLLENFSSYDERYGGSSWSTESDPGKPNVAGPSIQEHKHTGLNGNPQLINLENEVSGELNLENINLTKDGLTGQDILFSKTNETKTIYDAIEEKASSDNPVVGPLIVNGTLNTFALIEQDIASLTNGVGQQFDDAECYNGHARKVTNNNSTGLIFKYIAKLRYSSYLFNIRLKSSVIGITSDIIDINIYSCSDANGVSDKYLIKNIKINPNSPINEYPGYDINKIVTKDKYQTLYYEFDHDGGTNNNKYILIEANWNANGSNPIEICFDSFTIMPNHISLKRPDPINWSTLNSDTLDSLHANAFAKRGLIYGEENNNVSSGLYSGDNTICRQIKQGDLNNVTDTGFYTSHIYDSALVEGERGCLNSPPMPPVAIGEIASSFYFLTVMKSKEGNVIQYAYDYSGLAIFIRAYNKINGNFSWNANSLENPSGWKRMNLTIDEIVKGDSKSGTYTFAQRFTETYQLFTHEIEIPVAAIRGRMTFGTTVYTFNTDKSLTNGQMTKYATFPTTAYYGIPHSVIKGTNEENKLAYYHYGDERWGIECAGTYIKDIYISGVVTNSKGDFCRKIILKWGSNDYWNNKMLKAYGYEKFTHRDHSELGNKTETFIGNGQKKIFNLLAPPKKSTDRTNYGEIYLQVKVNGNIIPTNNYAIEMSNGWPTKTVTFNTAPANNSQIEFIYSYDKQTCVPGTLDYSMDCVYEVWN